MLNESEIVRIVLRERIEILSYIDSFLDDAHLAEDCFQDVCAAAVAKRDLFDDETHVIRWTLRVARNKAIDLARARWRQPLVLDEDVLECLEQQWFDESTASSFDSASKIDALSECLDRLTAHSRQIVDLRYVDGLKSSRIADLLDCKVGSIYRVLARAHGVLRECMDNKSSDASP